MAEVHTISCDVCKTQKERDRNGWFVLCGWNDGTEGVIVLHAPSKIEDLAKYDQHACGLEHAMQLAQKRLAPQPPAREILPTPTLEPFPQDKTDKWDDMHANFFDKEAPKA